MPIPKTDTFIRLAGWHKQIRLSTPPKTCDVMLITQNPDDCWREKAKYCLDNNIPYKCIPYKQFGDPAFEDNPIIGKDKVNTFFKHWTIISSSGGLAYCYANWGTEENVFNMSPPLMRDMTKNCLDCGGMLGLLEFMDDDYRQKLAEMRDMFIYSRIYDDN